MIRRLFPRWFVAGGAVPDVKDKRDLRYDDLETIKPVIKVIDQTRYYPKIQMQGSDNACVNFALAGNMYFLKAMQAKKLGGTAWKSEFSNYYVWNSVRVAEGTFGKNVGIQSRNAIQHIRKVGIPLKEMFVENGKTKPTNLNDHAARMFRLNNLQFSRTDSKGAVADALSKDYAIYSSVAWTNDMMKPVGGIIYEKDNKPLFGHGIELVGFNPVTDMFKIRNSWDFWGINGFAWIDADYFLEQAYDTTILRLI